MQGSESKRLSQGHESTKSPDREAEDLSWNPDFARSYCLTLGLSFHIYSSFTYANYVLNTAGGDGLKEINGTVPAL